MDTQNIFLQTFIYLAAALVAIIVGKRLGIGAVLGYLLMGIVIGPFGLRIIGHSEDIMHFAEFGVVMMLFLIGLELQPQMLWRMRRKILGLGGLQVVFTTATVCAVAMSFGLVWQQSLAIGMILSLSSTAIILQTLTERGLIQTEAGKSSFAVLLFQDIIVIPIIAVLPLLATMEPPGGGGEGHATANFLHHFPGWAQALVTIGSVALIVLVARWACRPLFRMIASTRQMEAFTTAALLIVIGVAILMNFVGLSPALGAFVAGVVLASSEYRHELESDLAPFKGILLGIFFISVGVGIDFSHIAGNLFAVIGLTLGLITLKGLLLVPLARVNGLNHSTSLLFASAMAAGGEFAFVLLNITLGDGVLPADTVRTITAGVALSMALTPPLIILTQRLIYREPTEKRGTGEPDVEDENSPVIICGFGRYGHAVGRLLRTQGFGCTVLDWDEDQITTLREIGIPVFYGDASRPDLLAAAGAAKAKVLVLAIKDAHTVTKIIQSVRHSFPHLKIYIRALGRLEAYEFLDIGEENVYRETLDSSLLMSEHIMNHLGFPMEKSKKATCHYRTHDEKMIREMARHRHDRKAYVSNARRAVATFDELMRANMDEDTDCRK
eukprot:g3563.t1